MNDDVLLYLMSCPTRLVDYLRHPSRGLARLFQLAGKGFVSGRRRLSLLSHSWALVQGLTLWWPDLGLHSLGWAPGWAGQALSSQCQRGPVCLKSKGAFVMLPASRSQLTWRRHARGIPAARAVSACITEGRARRVMHTLPRAIVPHVFPLPHHSLSLRSFSTKTWSEFVCKGLIRISTPKGRPRDLHTRRGKKRPGVTGTAWFARQAFDATPFLRYRAPGPHRRNVK